MNIFDNAIASIQMALEDFEKGSYSRLLSAVRNLNAGLLLLYKSKLSELSPMGTDDVLIKKFNRPRKLPDGTILFVGHGKKTVDVQEIKERFKSLGIQTDWNRFDKINGLRNEIEHHFTTINADGIRGIMADTFAIVRSFIKNELGLDPKSELGDETWGVLLSVAEVVEKEREECRRLMALINWDSPALDDAAQGATCKHCSSELLVPGGVDKEHGMECRSCSECETFESFAERVLSSYFAWQNYRAASQGGEEALTTCPFCHQHGYIVEEGQCAICGEHCETECEFCGNKIPTSEFSDESVCGWCSHMLSKDD